MSETHVSGNKLVMPLIICAVVVGAIAFYSGMLYGKSQATAALAANPRGTGMGTYGAGAGGAGGRGGRGFGGGTSGQVVSNDGSTLTIQTTDGSSKIVVFSSSTRIGEMTNGTSADLVNGANVLVNGQTNTDGSITATNIQIRPAGMMGGSGRGFGAPNASGTPVTPPTQP